MCVCLFSCSRFFLPGRVARLTQEPEVPGSIPGPAHTFVSSSVNSRRAVVIVNGETMCTKHWLTA